MVRRRLTEAAEAMNGRLTGDADGCWQGAALDSRRIAGGELFFALAGEHTDGHRFVAEALARGAAGAVVSRPISGTEGVRIEVDDTYRALHRLTRHVRRTVPEHLVAITGSAGKTTTKELLVRMLGVRYRVAASPGNLNNTYGFPIALLGIADDTEWMVAEMGMSTPGELAAVARLGRPDVAIFTNVRAAHLEQFERPGSEPSLLGITEAKAELLEGLADGGLLVANAGDPQVVRIAERYRNRGRVLWWGLRPESLDDLTLWVVEVEPRGGGQPGSRFVVEAASGERAEVELELHGEVNVENFLAAATCALALDLTLEEIAGAVVGAGAAPGRGELHRLAGGARLIDDSYNSNPDALAQALRAARALTAERHWAVLGSMLELGSASDRFHRQAGELAAALGFSPVIGVGEECRQLVDAAGAAGSAVEWFAEAAAAAGFALAEAAPGDVILVKGSRGVGLERVVAALRAGRTE